MVIIKNIFYLGGADLMIMGLVTNYIFFGGEGGERSGGNILLSVKEDCN